MNRKTVTGIVLAISILFNLLLFVFSYVQKAAADTARELAVENARQCAEQTRLAKAQLDMCEGLKARAEQAREECERKVLAISNRK
ncbi:MAG TPA: hypothetical protein VGD40_17540 [Chryseosolibacter sp.]